jgi:DNA-binding CsgD family transcriptional regulator
MCGPATTASSSRTDLLEQVRQLRSVLGPAGVPSLIVDLTRTVVWQNDAADALFGDRRGTDLSDIHAPGLRARGREHFRRKVSGEVAVTTFDSIFTDCDGRTHAMGFTSVVIRARNSDEVVGVLAMATTPPKPLSECEQVRLTARQHQVLVLLSEGVTTCEIAERLVVARETARNHIRAVFQRLGVHSRLDAVREARRRGLLDDADTRGVVER